MDKEHNKVIDKYYLYLTQDIFDTGDEVLILESIRKFKTGFLSILGLGSNKGILLNYLAQNLNSECVGIEINESRFDFSKNLSKDTKNCSFLHGDYNNILPSLKKFDIIWFGNHSDIISVDILKEHLNKDCIFLVTQYLIWNSHNQLENYFDKMGYAIKYKKISIDRPDILEKANSVFVEKRLEELQKMNPDDSDVLNSLKNEIRKFIEFSSCLKKVFYILGTK